MKFGRNAVLNVAPVRDHQVSGPTPSRIQRVSNEQTILKASVSHIDGDDLCPSWRLDQTSSAPNGIIGPSNGLPNRVHTVTFRLSVCLVCYAKNKRIPSLLPVWQMYHVRVRHSCGQSFHLNQCMRCRDDAESDHKTRKGKQQALVSAPERDQAPGQIHHNACLKHFNSSTDHNLTDRSTCCAHGTSWQQQGDKDSNSWHLTFRFQHGPFAECFGSEVTGVSAVVFSYPRTPHHFSEIPERTRRAEVPSFALRTAFSATTLIGF